MAQGSGWRCHISTTAALGQAVHHRLLAASARQSAPQIFVSVAMRPATSKRRSHGELEMTALLHSLKPALGKFVQLAALTQTRQRCV
jgi:hypothetical protein